MSATAQAEPATQETVGHGHGSETFFVLGEGLLGESRGGRDLETADIAVSGDGAGPAAVAAKAAPPFRFTRMGPRGRALARDTRLRVARAMTAGGGGFSDVPSGYTYLGQFIDHDLTFDKTNVTLGTDVSPAHLLQGRSPALDLDSLYGSGPGDPGSERFYGPQGLKLLVGKTQGVGSGRLAAHQGFDLPRDASAKLAIIPDKRNDENLAVAQTHLAFVRFHNRVIGELGSVPAAKRFARARRLVTEHYQWMIRHDYLPRICDAAIVDDVFANGRKLFEVGASPTAVPTMPIEFSVAAFRLGHSMVRGAYNWNVVFDNGAGTLDLLFNFSGTSGALGNGTRLPSNWIADFRRLYPFKQTALKVPQAKFNFARRIDTRLASLLSDLPPGSFGASSPPQHAVDANLAFRNLARAKMVKLATGQGMVTFLKSRGVSVKALTAAQIRDGDGGASLAGLTAQQRSTFVANTPLWFYILREAELNNGKLTGVGARIVAETLHRAMEGSSASIIRDPTFKPSFGPDDHTFDMRDLLFFAFDGNPDLLNPLGD
jgi:Animal haem peroxidase